MSIGKHTIKKSMFGEIIHTFSPKTTMTLIRRAQMIFPISTILIEPRGQNKMYIKSTRRQFRKPVAGRFFR